MNAVLWGRLGSGAFSHEMLKHVKGVTELINKRSYLESLVKPNANLLAPLQGVMSYFSYLIFGKDDILVPSLGRLCKLYEAAGKVRIIAIVDPFTNWLLKPLHDWIFAILAAIPQDGTFDQEKPIQKLMDSHKRSFIGSCDMSAATDRLPVLLQSMILSHLLGPKVARA
jgi:hypothetical protein